MSDQNDPVQGQENEGAQSEAASNDEASIIAELKASRDANLAARAEEEGVEEPTEDPQKPEPEKKVDSPIERSRKVRIEREARRAAKEAEAARAEAAQLKKELEEIKSDRWKAVGGRDGAEELIKGVLEGKYEEANLTPEQVEQRKYKTEIEQMKSEIERIKQEREELARAQREQEDLSHVSKVLDDVADEFPVLHAVGERWARKEALKRAYKFYEETGEAPDLKEIFAELQETVLEDVIPLVDNERALRHLLSDPKRREMVSKILNAKAGATPSRSNGRLTGDAQPKKVGSVIPASVKSEVTSRYETSDNVDPEAYEQEVKAWLRQNRSFGS